MKKTNYLTNLIGLVCLLFTGITLSAQSTISGTVSDESGEVLIGANVIVEGTSDGTITDFDGKFEFSTSAAFPLTLMVSFTGYNTQNINLDGPASNMAIMLTEGVLIGEDIVISASRKREKIIEAPASISVINARKMAASPNDNPARNLINMPGVTIQQQSAAFVNIQLRGDGGLFGSATFPILDYRSLAGPGLGTFDPLNSPLNNVDIDRIEVVRGPGSALYGPDVTAGVIHFISKSAIDQPGTTIELIGGELNTFGASFRHATKVSDKFGFKVNGVLKRGDEFTLDPNDPIDKVQTDQFSRTVNKPTITNGIVDISSPGTELLSEADLDPDGDGNMMQDDWSQFVLNANLEFRPADDLSINIAGGTNSASHVFYNSQGEGLSNATEYWTQARFQKGGLFGQVFWLTNDGGQDDNPTFLYQTGNTTRVQRTQLEGQLQYNFSVPSFLDADFTAGTDYRSSAANTFNQVYGREEEDDDFIIYGAYLQGKFALGEKLDLVVAGRVDKFNFFDETAFQPRAVLVYKASPKHTFRGGYNRAIGAPSQLQVNIDFPVSVFNVPGLGTVGDAWLQGNKGALTFGDNPMIVWNSYLQGLGLPNLPVGTPGLPNAVTYGAATAGLLPQLIPGIGAALGAGGVPADQAAAIAQNIGAFLASPANFPAGFTGSFEGFNIQSPTEPLGLIDAPVASLRTEDTWEFGYKGLIGDKLGVLLDVYNKKLNGATLFTGISPTYRLNNLNIASDLVGNINSANIEAHIFGLLGGAANPAAAPTAAALTQNIIGGYAAAGAATEAAFGPALAGLAANGIMAWTPTEQSPNNGIPHLGLGYRTFEDYSYTGVDFGMEYYVNQDLSLFGNFSYVSENQFTPVIQGSGGQTGFTANSVPKDKFRLGFNLTPEYGWRASGSFQHEPSFPVVLGDFTGDTDEKNLVDAGVGYRFDNGLSLDVSAQNLFDSEYRYYPHFPKLGRRVLGKLTYSFGGDGAPDADGDGVKDKKDACPNISGLKDFAGCPDSDGDGIIDSQDDCPMNAGSAANGGCPDADGDGVRDSQDDCPNEAGTANGCPDANGDGISDAEDARRAAAAAAAKAKADAEAAAAAEAAARAKAAADAAAARAAAAKAEADAKAAAAARRVEIETRTTEVFSRAIEGINFVSSRSTLKSSSDEVLDEVASIMAQYPEINLSIEGHTDSQGREDSNMKLSSSRANSVMEYLVAKGVSALRLSAVGFGESAPIADNNTAKGRAQNRRVEFKVRY